MDSKEVKLNEINNEVESLKQELERTTILMEENKRKNLEKAALL